MTTHRWFFASFHRWALFCGLLLAAAQLFTPFWVSRTFAATTNCTPNGTMQTCTVTFNYTGAVETWTVPTGVTQATFDLYGAGGGSTVTSGNGGKGGRVMTTLMVTPGATYQIRVGGRDGYNGGGTTPSGATSNGGGASDVRTGAFGLPDRVLVAGGGGGAGKDSIRIAPPARPIILPGGNGGNGGYPSGTAGTAIDASGTSGAGGSQTAGGGENYITVYNGSLGQGGIVVSPDGNGGGGGGGYYGGGASVGIGSLTPGGGGGGGSSYGPAGATFETGVRDGDGLVIITYTSPNTGNPTNTPVVPTATPTNTPQPSTLASAATLNDFADISSLALNGNALQVGNVLRLASAASQRGSAYLKTASPVASFQTRFQFRFQNASVTPVEGLTFAIQSAGLSALGNGGSSLGYGGITSSVAVFFDLIGNCGQMVGIAINGNGVDGCNEGMRPPFDLYGSPVTTWVDYDENSKTLKVFLAQDTLKPATPLLTRIVDIRGIVGANAFVGFTAATAGASFQRSSPHAVPCTQRTPWSCRGQSAAEIWSQP